MSKRGYSDVEAAKYLGVSPSTFREKVPPQLARDVMGCKRYDVADLDRLFETAQRWEDRANPRTSASVASGFTLSDTVTADVRKSPSATSMREALD